MNFGLHFKRSFTPLIAKQYGVNFTKATASSLIYSQREGFNSSTKSNFEQPESFVKSQKLGRPMSPITIYKPQITSVLSISSRVTGAGLGVGIYGFAALYSFNLLDPTAFVSLVHSFPVLVGLAKAAIAYPVAFHSANGIRHLIWDTGLFLKVRDVYATGYTVLAFTAIAGTALLFL